MALRSALWKMAGCETQTRWPGDDAQTKGWTKLKATQQDEVNDIIAKMQLIAADSGVTINELAAS